MGTWTPPPFPPRLAALRRIPLVGRAPEIQALEEAWSRVEQGHGQAFFIGGEPGVGKTRLAAEAAARMHRQGATVLTGSSRPEPGLAYRPFAEMIDHLLSHAPAGSLAEAIQHAGPQLAPLSEQLATHARMVGVDPLPTTRHQLYGAVARLFRHVARLRPLVLVLDDLHWAQSDTLSLLCHIIESNHDTPSMTLGTFRTTAPDRSDELTAALGDLHRLVDVRRLDLAGLGARAIAEYLMGYGGVEPAEARSLAAVLRERTGGNPLFLRELWHDIGLRHGTSALHRSDGVPSSIRDTLDARLSRLGGTTRRVLELAAVAGEVFDVAVLVRSQEERGLVLSAIDAATAAGLIEPERDRDGVYSFVHALVRQAVMETLAPSRLMELHARVADALAAPGPRPELVPELADHYIKAHHLGYEKEAVRYAAEAGELSERSLAYEDAARWYERASALPTTPDERAALSLAAAANRLRAGDFARARETYAQLASVSEPAVRLEAAMGFEQASWRPGLTDARAMDLLSEAIEAYGSSPDDVLYVRALASLGRAIFFTGARDEARRVGNRALAQARRLDDLSTIAHALEASLWHGLAPDVVEVELARATELAEIARGRNQHEVLAVASHFRALAAYMLTVPEDLDVAASDLRQAAAALDQPFFNYVTECVAQGRALLSGDFPGAEQRAQVALDIGGAFGVDTTEGSHGVQMFLLHRETGRLDRFRSYVDERASFRGRWVTGLLALYTELEMPEGAARALTHVLNRDLDALAVEAHWPIELVFMAEGALFLEDVEAGRMILPHLSRYRGTNLLGGQFVAPLGSADGYLARLHALLGDDEAAAHHFEAATKYNERIGSVIHTAETLAHHAVFAARQGEEAQAGELAARARALAEPIGQWRVLRMLEEFSAGSLPAGLTAREIDVLRLLAEGLSNREIAQRLYISANTAANHVRSIFAKTGATNRTQAAMYAADHDLA